MSSVDQGSLTSKPSLLSHQSSFITLKPTNKKRETEFRGLFPSLDAEEQLIESFSCALNREILIHGRLYLSERHICFNANILGWVTNVIIPIKDIMSIEKRMTAFVIPNAIQISTLEHKFFFTSFISREQTYQKFLLIWKNALSESPISGEELIRRKSMVTNRRGSFGSLPDTPRKDSFSIKAQSDRLALSKSMKCGCSRHLQEKILELKDIDFEKVYARVYSDQARLRNETLRKIASDSGDKKEDIWESDEFGIKRRSFVTTVTLPGPFQKASLSIKATFTDTLLADIHQKHAVIETDVVYEGIPGGSCSMLLRQCLSPSSFSVTAFFKAPESCWFKESIKQALLAKMQDVYQEMAISLGERQINDRPEPVIQQVYFDLNAFLRSLKTMAPVIIVLLLMITFTRFGGHKKTISDDARQLDADVVEKIEAVRQKHAKLVDMSRLDLEETRNIMKRIADRIADISSDSVYR